MTPLLRFNLCVPNTFEDNRPASALVRAFCLFPLAMPDILFINKTQSSEALTRCKPSEKSRIFRHVQNRRRKDEARRRQIAFYGKQHEGPSDESDGLQVRVIRSQPHKPKHISPKPSSSSPLLIPQPQPDGDVPERRKLINPTLLGGYLTHNSSDPFYSTVAGRDVGSHTMLSLTFHKGAKMTFLSEAFAPLTVLNMDSSGSIVMPMRHEQIIQARLHRCVHDGLLMNATLAYGSSCLAWMFGILDPSRPPEYFIGKALSQMRLRLATTAQRLPDGPGGDDGNCAASADKKWLALSIYSLAITENWNHMPPIWARCPPRQALALREDNSSRAASRMHLQALVGFVDGNGGWRAFDPYIKESAILADKFLSLWEMKPPIIPLTWDPGPVPPGRAGRGCGLDGGDRLAERARMGRSLLRLPLKEELKSIVSDVVDYEGIARAAWAQPEAVTFELQSWLFLRLQSFYSRLMLLDRGSISPLDDCVRVVVVAALLTSTQHQGAAMCPPKMASRIKSALARLTGQDESQALSQGFQFWCLHTGLVAAGKTPERQWFQDRIMDMMSKVGEDAKLGGCNCEGRESLNAYLFLRDPQASPIGAGQGWQVIHGVRENAR